MDPTTERGRLLQAAASSDAVDLKLSADILFNPTLPDFLTETKVTTVWVEVHGTLAQQETRALLEKISELSDEFTIIPIMGSVPLIREIIENHPAIKLIALKGNEASGFVGSETTFTLYAAVRQILRDRDQGPGLCIWGSVALPEAAAAFFATGSKRIVFESVHWLTDLFSAPEDFKKKAGYLRPDHTELVGLSLGVPCRLFNRGNSRAVKKLKESAALLCGLEITDAKRAEFRENIRRQLAPAHLGSFSRSELIPAGIEASFASSFTERYGSETETAIARFIKEIDKHLAEAPKAVNAFADSPVALEMGVRYPLIQGAMSWITDNPHFARRVAEAGGLATIALGMMDETVLEDTLANLSRIMGDYPWAVNIITLDENPFREAQLAWIKRTKPHFAVVAAGEPTHVADLIAAGIETLYIAPNEELMRLAFEQGVNYAICEGNEAGGHVGQYTTLTWAQIILDLKRQNPALFEGRRIILAGGVFNRETAFMAAMLGADAVQMGTVYLSVSDIIETGALTALYQKMIIESEHGSTVITGEAAGLRVRSLRTAAIDSICSLERDFVSKKENEISFRRKIEALSAGSLCVAARGRNRLDGSILDEKTCIEQGQFMSGVAAGAIDSVKSAQDLHLELAGGPLAAGLPFTGPLIEEVRPDLAPGVCTKVAMAAQPSGRGERIAITGMSVVNCLGNSPQAVWAACLNKKSGISHVPSDKWSHELFYHPRRGMPEKTYCKFGGFQHIEVKRKEIGVSPQDFRTMTGSTKITLWLASNAIRQSGILESDIPRERIAVLISQNSGEAAATLGDVIIRASVSNIMAAVNRVAHLPPDLQTAAEDAIKAGRIAIDDTTLLGRLNCSAAGFICNRFGFMGPSFSVSAACATSLVALYSAYQMIRNGVIDAAIVGGAEEFLTPMHFLEFSALGALAGLSGVERPPHEASRPFDSTRDGMVLGEGGGMIVVEREPIARRRGAEVHAYITSMGASNNHLGMVESSRITQGLAIRASLRGLPYGPESIHLVECHATGTMQGDVEEAQALKSIFQSSGKTVLTSFKSQIGHTLGASGVNSLIRGVMAMNAGVFPPTLNYRNPDPEMDLDGSSLAVYPEPEDWSLKNGGPRRMQVNAFGFGGSNYVVQLEQNMVEEGSVLVLKSRSDIQQDKTKAEFCEGLSFFRTEIDGRPYRLAVLAESGGSALELLDKSSPLRNGEPVTATHLKALMRQGIHLAADEPAPRLAFVFSGQGSHYAGMGHELYQTFPIIREWLDRAASFAEFDLLHLMFHDREENARKTRWQQPALFALEYSIVQYLWSLGIRPAALAGHSLGELTALCLAGVFSFQDGFRIVNKRAVCMDKACTMHMDPGVMMAVSAPMEVLRDFMADRRDVCITNINSPFQLVVGGGTEDVKLLGDELKRNGYRCTLLPVSMAFHSPVMRCIHDELDAFITDLEFRAPQIPVVSNTTMEPFPDDPNEIKHIIMAHLESPVNWMQNVQTLWNDFGVRLFVEVGPREVLSNLVIDSIEEAECIPTCLPSTEALTFNNALARLHARGNLPVHRPVRFISFPGTKRSGGSVQSEAATSSGAPVQQYLDPLETIVQKQIGSFILESFGKFLKPVILSSIRAEYDPSFSEQGLEMLLGRMFPGLGNLSGSNIQQEIVPTSGQEATSAVQKLPPVPSCLQGTVTEPVSSRIEDVTEALIHIIMEVTGYERDEIEPYMDLRQDLAIRSIRLPVIIDLVEGRFGINTELADFRDSRTIQDIAEAISNVMARGKSNKASGGDQDALLRSGIASQMKDAPGGQPIKRVVFKETAVDNANAEPVELMPHDSVVVFSAGSNTGLRERVGDVFRQDYGCSILHMSFVEDSRDVAGGAFDPRTAEDTHLVAKAMRDAESLAGFAIVLDNSVETGIRSIEDVSLVLGGFFSLLKAFLDSPDKKLVILINMSDEPWGFARLLTEGLLGVFLSAAHEFAGVLFRTVRVSGEADVQETIRGALDRSQRRTETAIEAGRILTLSGEASPIVFREDPSLRLGGDDVILFSGGCCGIMPHLARGLVPYGCKAAFVGRAPFDPNPACVKSGDEGTAGGMDQSLNKGHDIISSLNALRDTGIEAEYFQGDVSDPESIASVVRSIRERFGTITGVVHGAGILRDNLIHDMTVEDFSAVVKVKLIGAWRLFEETRGALKFFACLSSVACIQGNRGQANYACGNRAMSALLSHFSAIQGNILFKAFMLPPVEGAGMADNPDIKAVMKLMNAGYIHVDELSVLFARELVLGPPEEVWVLFLRSLPDVKAVRLITDAAGGGKGIELDGILYDEETFPLIDSISNLNLLSGELVAERSFNPEDDLWISDHKPFKFMKHPLVSAIMALELFMEACRILHPTLKVTGVREARFLDIIECPAGVTRDARVDCKTVVWKADEAVCEVFLSTKAISPSGRILDRMNLQYKALVQLGAMPQAYEDPADFSVKLEELDTRPANHEEVIKWYQDRSDMQNRYRVIDTLDGTAPEAIRGRMIYRAGADFKPPRVANYQYSPYLLESIFQLVGFYVPVRNEAEQRSMIPLRIGEVTCRRKCADGEVVSIEARIREQDGKGITWDARAAGQDGEVIMTVKELRMGWFF
jgi:acyl transferase domain-containing protein/NAD(P)H-dependent flavin oxidoreductase YrpB (nitropropane dioxygenase family)/NAD(P)-dependent dehydrogenase (short-subunit alcohol dehydrogenase family)/acyl carrier protein